MLFVFGDGCTSDGWCFQEIFCSQPCLFARAYVIQPADTYVIVSDIARCMWLYVYVFFELIETAQWYPIFRGGPVLFSLAICVGPGQHVGSYEDMMKCYA